MNRYKLSKAGVNATEGISRFNGDKDMYERILYSFPEDTHFAQLRDAIAQRDIKAAFSAAHSLKGMAGNLSLTRLYDDIYPLVEELRAESFEHAEELFQPVSEDYHAVIEVLSKS